MATFTDLHLQICLHSKNITLEELNDYFIEVFGVDVKLNNRTSYESLIRTFFVKKALQLRTFSRKDITTFLKRDRSLIYNFEKKINHFEFKGLEKVYKTGSFDKETIESIRYYDRRNNPMIDILTSKNRNELKRYNENREPRTIKEIYGIKHRLIKFK